MSLTKDIMAYWQNNGNLSSIIPPNKIYVDIMPEGTALPLAVLMNNDVKTLYTSGTPKLLEYHFTIEVWSNSLQLTEQYEEIIIAQFEGQRPVPRCAGCWHEDSVIIAEEHDEPNRYGYAKAINFMLYQNAQIKNSIIQS